MMLTLLLARPEWQLVGLSSVFGNAGVAQTTEEHRDQHDAPAVVVRGARVAARFAG